MNRRLELVIIISVVVAITAIISRSITASLGIETTPSGYWVTGPGAGRASVFLAGSSLAGDGLAWKEISGVLNLRIGGWGGAGSSPSEWERFQHLAAQAKVPALVGSPLSWTE